MDTVYSQGAFYDIAKDRSLLEILDGNIDHNAGMEIQELKVRLQSSAAKLRDASNWHVQGKGRSDLDELVRVEGHRQRRASRRDLLRSDFEELVRVEKHLHQDILHANEGHSNRRASYLFKIPQLLSNLSHRVPEHEKDRLQGYIDELSRNWVGADRIRSRQMDVSTRFLTSEVSKNALQELRSIRRAIEDGLSSKLFDNQRTRGGVRPTFMEFLTIFDELNAIRQSLVERVNARCAPSMRLRLNLECKAEAYTHLVRLAGFDDDVAESIRSTVNFRTLTEFIIGAEPCPDKLRPIINAIAAVTLSPYKVDRLLSQFEAKLELFLAEIGEYRDFKQLSIGQRCLGAVKE